MQLTAEHGGDVDDHCDAGAQGRGEDPDGAGDQFYGDRTYRAVDLEGHIWTFGQTVEVVPPEQWEAATGSEDTGRAFDRIRRRRVWTLDRTLAALADPHPPPHGGAAAGTDLGRRGSWPGLMGLTPPAMSRHLKLLRQSGVVEESSPAFDARVRIYALRPEPMVHLLRWLEENRTDVERTARRLQGAHRDHRSTERRGTKRRRVTSRIIVALRVAASPERAFEVFTEEVGLWWRPNGLFRLHPQSPGKVAFEGGLGGRFIETLPDGKVFEIGRITAWEPGVRWRSAGARRPSRRISRPRSRCGSSRWGTQTRVTVEHRGWDSVPADHVARHHFPDAMFLRRHGEWWGALLTALQRERSHDRAPSIEIVRRWPSRCRRPRSPRTSARRISRAGQDLRHGATP